VLESLGSRTSSYAGRPATSTELSVVTVVVGSNSLSTLLAASSGVTGVGVGVLPASAVTVRCVAAFSLLDHVQTFVPSLMMSYSL